MQERYKRHARRSAMFFFIFTLTLATALPVHAAGGGPAMPWDNALQNILQNLSGTVARTVIAIATVLAGIMWAFTEHSTGVKRLSQIIVAAGICLEAVSFLGSLGFTGALF